MVGLWATISICYGNRRPMPHKPLPEELACDAIAHEEEVAAGPT